MQSIVQQVQEKIRVLADRLASLQRGDGGLRAYRLDDRESGLWTTASAIHISAKTLPEEPGWVVAARDYLARNRNEDGGWPFRPGGKSTTDVTAWCCLALATGDKADLVRRGVQYLIRARENTGSDKEAAWGLTTFEPDRVYSTMVASYCLSRLLRERNGFFPAEVQEEIRRALADARAWLKAIQNPDGGWGAGRGGTTTCSATAMALLALFMQGEDPRSFGAALRILEARRRGGLWDRECEAVVTREGYELNQEWFTSLFCFRALVFFAELGLASLDDVDATLHQLLSLVREDGSVAMAPGETAELSWPLAYMMEALDKFLGLVRSKRAEYNAFLARRHEEAVRSRKAALENQLHQELPYPVGHAFSLYEHELDFHRKFELMLQVFEVTLKYGSIVALSGYLANRECDPATTALLKEHFRRPSLGDWAALFQQLARTSEGFARLLAPQRPQEVTGLRKGYLEGSGRGENLAETLSAVISLRNTTTGHGAIRSLYEYKLMIERERERLYSFIERMLFLARSHSFLVLESRYDEFGDGDLYRVRVFKGLNIQDSDLETDSRLSEGQKDSMIRYLYFQNSTNNTIVNLYPFLSYMFCDDCRREHFFFFNGLRNDGSVDYLSYECGHHSAKSNLDHYRKRLSASAVQWE